MSEKGTMQNTYTDQTVQELLAAGIRRVYGVGGQEAHPAIRALQKDARVQWVAVPQAETAAFAAAADAQLTGRPAACCGSSEGAEYGPAAGTGVAPGGAVPPWAQAAGIPLQVFGMPAPAEPWPDAAAVAEMACLLNAAPHITFICGAGCAAARAELLELAERLQCPMVYTLRSKEFLEHDNRYAVGMTGPAGFGAAPKAVLEADVLVLWGTDFADVGFLPQEAVIIEVQAGASASPRRIRPHLTVRGDVAAVARTLLPLLSVSRDGEFLAAAQERHTRLAHRRNRCLWNVDENAPLLPEYLTRLVSDYAEPDAVFACDGGAPLVWAARFVQGGPRRRLLGGNTAGAVVCASALSLGAKAVYPTRQVIALCGHNGQQQMRRNWAAMAQAGMAVKMLVYNPTTAPLVAESAEGAALFTLRQPAAAADTVKAWLAYRGPALLEAAIDSRALPQPPNMEHLRALCYCAPRRSA